MTHTVDGQATSLPDPAHPGPASEPAASAAAGQDRAAGTPGKPRRERDPFFDNAKFLAIILVVVGHAIQNLRDMQSMHALYMFIYMFHMPVFIVITGYFSRNFTFSGGKAQKLITNLAVPYVVFEIAYSTYRWAVDGADFKLTLLDPYYLTWFLMALFAWRLSAPVWAQIRWPLAVAVVISLMSGMNELARELEMNRILGMLPFFVLGLLLKPEHFEWLKRPAARLFGGLTLAGGLIVAFLVHNLMTTEWVYWRHGNDYLNVDVLTGSSMRLGLLVCSAALVAAFLSLVPTRQTWFTKYGSLTLYAYLLHGIVTKGFQYVGWWDAAWLRTFYGVPVVFLGTSLLAIGLMTPPVRWLFRWAMEPRMSWAFTRPRRPRHQVHQGAHRAPERAPEAAGTAGGMHTGFGDAHPGLGGQHPGQGGARPGYGTRQGREPGGPGEYFTPAVEPATNGPPQHLAPPLPPPGATVEFVDYSTAPAPENPGVFTPGPVRDLGPPPTLRPASAGGTGTALPQRSRDGREARQPAEEPGDEKGGDGDSGDGHTGPRSPHKRVRPPYGLAGWPQPGRNGRH